MEPWNIAKTFNHWVRQRFIESLSPGLRAEKLSSKQFGESCEELIARRCRKQKLKILARNVRVSGVEVDLIVERGNSLVLIEVRGRRSSRYRASETLSYRKTQRLKFAAERLAYRRRARVAVELHEVIWEGTHPKVRIVPLYF